MNASKGGLCPYALANSIPAVLPMHTSDLLGLADLMYCKLGKRHTAGLLPEPFICLHHDLGGIADWRL